MRENNEYTVKLPHILYRHRKICDQKKACHPQERNDNDNDKEHNQKDQHRFLRAFFMRVTAVMLLEHQRNEAPGAMHVFKVLLADGLDERLLLNAYPVQM